MPEIVDISVAISHLPLPSGRNVAVIGSGGGIGVQAADDIIKAGLKVPVLKEAVRRKLRSIYGTEAGCIFRNPVDVPPLAGKEMYIEAVRAIADSGDIDMVLMHFPFDIWALANRSMLMGTFAEVVTELAVSIKKPLAIVLHYCVSAKATQLAGEVQAKFAELGLPVFSSIPRAAMAISKYITYCEFKAAQSK
jgi:acyl-CoA synthetase (NDP forming)